jgi:hypothetical protein
MTGWQALTISPRWGTRSSRPPPQRTQARRARTRCGKCGWTGTRGEAPPVAAPLLAAVIWGVLHGCGLGRGDWPALRRRAGSAPFVLLQHLIPECCAAGLQDEGVCVRGEAQLRALQGGGGAPEGRAVPRCGLTLVCLKPGLVRRSCSLLPVPELLRGAGCNSGCCTLLKLINLKCPCPPGSEGAAISGKLTDYQMMRWVREGGLRWLGSCHWLRSCHPLHENAVRVQGLASAHVPVLSCGPPLR